MPDSKTPEWASHPDLVDYYVSQRCRVEDLYPSEQKFLPWLARQVKSVLDAGCAAGGFINVWRHFNPEISYTGVDISPSVVEAARESHRQGKFLVGNVTAGLTLPDRCFDAVSALGWLHWEPNYPQAITEMWRLARRYLFFDVRLVESPDQASIAQQRLALTKEWNGETTTPYVTVLYREFMELLLGLSPERILAYGYWGDPAKTVIGIDHKVCFAAFVIEKAVAEPPSGGPAVCIDLPLSWPEDLNGSARVLSPRDLTRLMQYE